MDHGQQEINDMLIQAVRHDNAQWVKQLLSAGADTNQGGHGWTALHEAALYDNTDCMILLIGSGTDVNVPDFSGWTPLHIAARYGNPGCMRLLIEAGADIGVKNNRDDTPLDMLRRLQPELYEKHIDSLMNVRPESKRLKSEDAAAGSGGPATTGFEFDI